MQRGRCFEHFVMSLKQHYVNTQCWTFTTVCVACFYLCWGSYVFRQIRCQCVCKMSKKLWTDFDEILWRHGAGMIQLHFGGSLGSFVDPWSFSRIFARDSIYAKRAYAIAIPSVCLSVCPSHGWISQKRLMLGSCNIHHTVAPSL